MDARNKDPEDKDREKPKTREAVRLRNQRQLLESLWDMAVKYKIRE
jgi:hypothetical protein